MNPTSFWAKHKIVSMSVLLSALQVAVVWGAVSYRSYLGLNAALKIATAGWLLGASAAILSAVVAIVSSDRKFGFLALMIAVLVFFVCAIPLTV